MDAADAAGVTDPEVAGAAGGVADALEVTEADGIAAALGGGGLGCARAALGAAIDAASTK
ncbi:MAG: hypothetical protein ACHREM_28335 [Polyangiales bacterium]